MPTKETAVARYLRIATTQNRRPNKRVRRAAWAEANRDLQDGLRRDRAFLEDWQARDTKRVQAAADAMYGADKYGRDVHRAVLVPLYREPLPPAPEHGFRFIGVAGKRRHLWHEGAWVELSSALMRKVESHALRVEFSLACQFQEAERWAAQAAVLVFRDQTMNIQRSQGGPHRLVFDGDDDSWPHHVTRIGVGRNA